MPLRIALASIVRNEAEYMLEWLAWHRNAGFTDFLIADNQSDDGTLELLCKLESAGVLRLHREPPGNGAQIKAYNSMLKRWGRKFDRIAFLDADEFLVSSDGRSPIHHLEELIAPPDVGAIAINWRLFGSSGHEHRSPGLVTERFTRCAPDEAGGCQHIKTYARTAAVALQRVHRCNLHPGFRYIDTAGKDMEWAKAGSWLPDPTGELSCSVGPGNLRVHHYAIKSRQEYVEKKRFRGDAMSGARDRTMTYFTRLDHNQLECVAAERSAASTWRTVRELESLIEGVSVL